MGLPTQAEQNRASANLSQAFADFIQDPLDPGHRDALEEAAHIYEAIHAGCTEDTALNEYRQYRRDHGTATERLKESNIIVG
ncbi:hypothetical protein [Salinibacter phage M8CRM-1]|uniref:Uncharacterized protein n=3 Tax=Kryptosalinivirus TaxID=2560163 RepID=A0A2I6UGB5_9CAUD|nr:hypothetical protein FGG63_gp59 [Salinibacter phage M8CC-19]YP_009639527.1 hypothetical protein FGG67_gp61 [Salinibacter phage M8CRM-1]AUO79010.1 hypothetical protein [Salinibacter phage M8CC-19]AUO79171.1 hypothetical protein [Salinibacter phage M8CRM-1]AUO79243.1 hypothetical protein [Salinibacter phage M31CC-1]